MTACEWAVLGIHNLSEAEGENDDIMILLPVIAAAMAEARAGALEEAAECCEMRSFAEQDARPLRAAAERIRALAAKEQNK